MWLIPLIKTTKPSTYVNHSFDETQTQNTLITTGENNRLGHTDLFAYVSNRESRGSEFESNHCHTMGKKSTGSNLNKLELTEFSQNSKSTLVNRANQKVTTTSFSEIFRLAGYLQVIILSGDTKVVTKK